MNSQKILVIGMGNLLRGDDGFGVAVAHTLLEEQSLDENVEVHELGIGGIALVQELMDGYDALIVVDAIDKGEPPGSLCLFEPQVADPEEILPLDLYRLLIDGHTADPSRGLLLAKALKVMPAKVFILGCQPESFNEFGAELSPTVQSAIRPAVDRIISLVNAIQAGQA